MYVLRIKKGPNAGKYVGRKGFRSWDWKPQDINNARTFANEAGVKRFHGTVYNKDKYAALQKEYQDNKDIRAFHKALKGIKIPYTDRYELVELKLQS